MYTGLIAGSLICKLMFREEVEMTLLIDYWWRLVGFGPTCSDYYDLTSLPLEYSLHVKYIAIGLPPMDGGSNCPSIVLV